MEKLIRNQGIMCARDWSSFGGNNTTLKFYNGETRAKYIKSRFLRTCQPLHKTNTFEVCTQKDFVKQYSSMIPSSEKVTHSHDVFNN